MKTNKTMTKNTDMFFWLGEDGEVHEVSLEEFIKHQDEWEGERPEDFDEDDAVPARGEEFTNDDPEKVGTGAIKYDGGKPCVYRGVVQYFPRATKAVAEISTFGANKYAWNGWEGVEDGIARYSDAMMRHFLYEAMGEEVDPDSNLLHAAHAAWGAMARLELILREKEE